MVSYKPHSIINAQTAFLCVVVLQHIISIIIIVIFIIIIIWHVWVIWVSKKPTGFSLQNFEAIKCVLHTYFLILFHIFAPINNFSYGCTKDLQ